MTRLAADPDRHLLVVDDDDRIRELLRQYLERAGFRVSVAKDAAAARGLIGSLRFDLLVLDVMMPGEDGFALLGWLRARDNVASRVPALMLTARGDADDRIEGLRLGADDYLAKPFEPRELTLRIQAILRRVAATPSKEEVVSLGARRFDPMRGELMHGDIHVRLTEAEARLLAILAASPHAPVTRWSLAGDSEEVAGRAVDIQVTRLRRKIENDPANPRYLRTVRGRGYMLTPD